MKEIKKYTDIIRYGKSTTEDVLHKGDYITITEKIDGANTSFIKDDSNELGVSCFSRNTPVNKDNTLRGFYQWVNDNIVPIKDKLNPNYRYFGEWLIPHKVIYKKEMYNNFYLFSIWDEKTEEYLSDEIVKSEATKLGLKQSEYFYEGEFISFEHLMSFVGKSNITETENTGEGVVVKNINYKDRYGKQIFVKLVSEKFAEVQKQKLPKNPNINTKEKELIDSVLTTARVRKLIYKLVDEGLLKENFDITDMGCILKLLGSTVYDDIMKEESDLFIGYEENNIKKTIGKKIPSVIKIVLKEENKM